MSMQSGFQPVQAPLQNAASLASPTPQVQSAGPHESSDAPLQNIASLAYPQAKDGSPQAPLQGGAQVYPHILRQQMDLTPNLRVYPKIILSKLLQAPRRNSARNRLLFPHIRIWSHNRVDQHTPQSLHKFLQSTSPSTST